MQPITREIIDRRQPAIRWSAVFAGAAVACGIWILLQVFGMGAGLAAVDTDNAGSLKGVGIGTTVWSLLAPLIAMFIGGYIAGKLAGSRDEKLGALHGVVVWALTSVLGVLATVSLVSALVAGAARAGGAAVSATGSVVSSAAGQIGGADAQSAMSTLGLSSDDLVAPINQRLRAQGKPTITAAQLENAARGAIRKGVRGGGFDRELFVNQLAANTNLSRADAEDIANQVGDRWQALTGRAEELGNQAVHAGLSAADAAGKALLAAGTSLLLSLGTALLGGLLGIRGFGRDKGNGRRREDHTTMQTPVVPPPRGVDAATD